MEKTTALSTYLQMDSVKQSIQSVMGSKSQQFVTSMTAAVNSNPTLQGCDKKSIIMSCLTASALDLPINSNLGFAYIIPYKNRDGEMVAQFQMGYKGYVQLSQRSGQMKTINVSDVREGEFSGVDRLTGEYKFSWIDEDREKLPVIGYVAHFELLNGFRKSIYMTKEELKKHGVKYSKSFKNGYGLWKDEFDTMAKKTILKLLLAKYAPLTTEMAKAIEADQAVIKGDGKYEYPDNEPVDADEIAKEKERVRIIKHIEDSKTVKELSECFNYLPDDETKEMYAAKLQLLTKETK